MTKLQWAGVIGALGLGVLAQIPTHSHRDMPSREHDGDLAGMTVDAGPATVILSVTGMT